MPLAAWNILPIVCKPPPSIEGHTEYFHLLSTQNRFETDLRRNNVNLRALVRLDARCTLSGSTVTRASSTLCCPALSGCCLKTIELPGFSRIAEIGRPHV